MWEWGVFTTVFAVLVILVNILTQIFKSIFSNRDIPTRVFVLVISIVLTAITFTALCQIYSIQIVWYMVAASVAAGFVVAYCAMFGYDNLYGELKALIKKLFGV